VTLKSASLGKIVAVNWNVLAVPSVHVCGENVFSVIEVGLIAELIENTSSG
jgi:hypothetical protein